MPEPDERSDAYHAAREEALSWLTANWNPSLTVRAWWARLADSGWGFPAWPTEWFGRGLSSDAVAGVRAAYSAAGVLPPPVGLGQMLGGPMLLVHGSQEQKARFLPALEKMYPHFRRSDVVQFRVSRVRHVLPISTLHYSTKLPPMQSSVPGVFLVNSCHIVNGTLNVNETVQLAERAVGVLLSAASPAERLPVGPHA